ncbi:MAG: phospho-N-acetylmuramoyl-pentapeptide-transferase [Thermocrispum sp.]
MISILIAASVGLLVSIMFTPYLIRVFVRQGFGQEIREEGPEGHKSKRGTPTMGGVAIIVAMLAGYFAAHVIRLITDSGQGPTVSGLLVLFLATGLGIVGFLDDFIKIRRQRNLGLNKTSKLVGQFVVAVAFAVLAVSFPDENDLTPASPHLSDVRDIVLITFPLPVFIVFCYLLISAWSNAVNFTDGLDGLAGGASAMVLGTYVVIAFWQARLSCEAALQDFRGCYDVRDPLDLAVVAAAAAGACIGFLWWNAAPAKIFMGDTGSLALGGLVAGLSVTTRTELLAIVIGGLFVVEMISVVVQIAVFRTTGRRLFRMAPFHHHFELGGWAETQVIIRFWLLAGICCGLGLGLFYSEQLTVVGG